MSYDAIIAQVNISIATEIPIFYLRYSKSQQQADFFLQFADYDRLGALVYELWTDDWTSSNTRATRILWKLDALEHFIDESGEIFIDESGEELTM